VEANLLAPLHIYERSPLSQDAEKTDSSPQIRTLAQQAQCGINGRNIGVGIWSTALQPLVHHYPSLVSHLEDIGSYVDNVGYRTPNGDFLATSRLDTHGIFAERDLPNHGHGSEEGKYDPALLFVKEWQFLQALRTHVLEQQSIGNLHLYTAKDSTDGSTTVSNITHTDSQFAGNLQFANGDISESDYHLIISASGTQCSLRKKYTGYCHLKKLWKRVHNLQSKDDINPKMDLNAKWESQQQVEKNMVESRGYTIFRGMAPLTHAQAKMHHVSFQTWGEGDSKRFAAVEMTTNNGTEQEQMEVWFATTSNPLLAEEKDLERRKELLLKEFSDWHDPVRRLVEATPAELIGREKAVAHKHCVTPVRNVGEILDYQQFQRESQSGVSSGNGIHFNSGPGPVLAFTGDAAMTVDPVLAQGFTIAMEAAADLADTLRLCVGNKASLPTSAPLGLAFNPEALRSSLVLRNQRRYGRMLSLLRSTELVQALAQPTSMSLSGQFSKNVVRPIMKWTPNFIRKAVFSVMMKYSLGLYGNYSISTGAGSGVDGEKR
jgi:2-polyprenyl-6-methoxyphenol hydroxylase-like FAD-dependent oxidoreductase